MLYYIFDFPFYKVTFIPGMLMSLASIIFLILSLIGQEKEKSFQFFIAGFYLYFKGKI